MLSTYIVEVGKPIATFTRGPMAQVLSVNTELPLLVPPDRGVDR